MTSKQHSMTSQEGVPDSEPSTPLTPGFDSLCFTADGDFLPDETSDQEDSHTPRDASRSYSYEPGVIRKMKKSGKYTLNSDVFETKSRPVSVASVHELDFEDNPAILVDEDTDKEEKFDSLHKPVLFLKSCPSPATFLHKKNLPPPSPTSLLGKLSLLDSIINDINETRIQDNVCVMCGREHHVTEQCLHSDGFLDSDTEIHCNPAFSAAKDQNVDKKAGGKRKKKKRRKVLKFGQSDDSSDAG